MPKLRLLVTGGGQVGVTWPFVIRQVLAQNTAVERTRLPKSRASSETRLSRAEEKLGTSELTLDDLLALTRDHSAVNGICVHPEEPFYRESCGAVIMRLTAREFWGVWGLPCQNEYERFLV